MTQAIVASIPVDSWFVPDFLAEILDKKISGIALNYIEEFVDWICSWIYCPYILLGQAKLKRIHRFSDQIVSLFDTTKKGVVQIKRSLIDHICLKNVEVCFSANPNIAVLFSREAFTEYVVVKDDEKNRPGWYKIIEQPTPRPTNPRPMEKCWLINTNEMHQFQDGMGQILPPVYLAKQA
jgi:hypothetical protein